MHTITTTHLSPLAVAAVRRVDADASIDGIDVGDWIASYWDKQISQAITASARDDAMRYGYEAVATTLGALADSLVSEDHPAAARWIADWRHMASLHVGDISLSEMIIEAILDWSRWTGDHRIDDARAQSWLRSLLA